MGYRGQEVEYIILDDSIAMLPESIWNEPTLPVPRMNTFQVKKAIWRAKRQAKQQAEKDYMAHMVQCLMSGEIGITEGFRWLVYDEPDWQAQGYTRYRRKRVKESPCR